MNIQELRNMFPALSRTVYGKPLVYFDNAATAQRPQSVIDKWTELTVGANANIHRAVHKLAVDATDEYESTRDAVKEYLNAASREEIVFTSGTTESINLVAFSFGETFVNEGDEIIVSEAEHHSDIVPWQMLCQRKGAVLRVLHVEEDGHLNLEELKSLLNPKTRIVAVTQISNVLGILNPVKEIVSICHSVGCPVLIDGAQGMVHEGVDVQEIPLFSFSVEGAHHEDLALILDKMGIAVRSGQMCAEPLMDRFGVTGMLRASLAPYNTMEEAEYFIKSLDKATAMLV